VFKYQAIDSAVRRLPAFVTVSRGNLSVSHVESVRKAIASTDVPGLLVLNNQIHTFHANITRYPEPAKWAFAITMNPECSNFGIRNPGHELLNGAVGPALRIQASDAIEYKPRNRKSLPVAGLPDDRNSSRTCRLRRRGLRDARIKQHRARQFYAQASSACGFSTSNGSLRLKPICLRICVLASAKLQYFRDAVVANWETGVSQYIDDSVSY
jgi:hypothetical protein